MVVEIGYRQLEITSASRSVGASLAVTGGSALSTFWTSVPTERVSTSPWLRLPAEAASLEVGDLISYYATQAEAPTQISKVLQRAKVGVVEIAKIDPPILSTQTWDLSAAIAPRAIARDGVVSAYNDLTARLEAWLALVPPGLFYDLRRAVAALGVGTATSLHVQAVLTQMARLQNLLGRDGSVTPELTLEAATEAYHPDLLPEIQAVFRALQEKGCDRGLDLLSEGQFTAFFSLSLELASYAGAMGSAIRDVAREDMPVQKVGRADRVQQRSLGTADTPDFEYDRSDIDTQPTPDIPEGV